ncbi:MAG: hypothetical protein MUO82_10830 [Candidatus Thermoplasmatota archaeon]|nr:hypothetical protein [Candidatus Thermoplasmatota archaeon]
MAKVIIKNNKEMRDHLGLHDKLPKGKTFPIIPPKGYIWINKKLTKKRRKQIIKHEKFENYLMKHKHMGYKKAHKISQKWEKN